jgi:hypothetical protein
MGLTPNFFVVGAPKAGTTSLYKHLSRHPDIFLSPIKEPNYFCTDLHAYATSSSLNDRLPLDIERYLSSPVRKPIQTAWVTDANQYWRLFQGADTKPVIGEFSTTYLYSSAAAHGIAAVCPQAKIIAVLRSPAERAYSHYLMDLRIGITTRSFREELLSESRDPDANWGNSRLYLELGRYAGQLTRYLDVFPAHQVLILDSEELRHQTATVLDRVCRFLEIPPQDAASPSLSENAASLSRFPALNRFLHVTRLKRKLRAVLPSSARRWLRRHYFVEAGNEQLEPEDSQLITDLLGSEPSKLAALLAKHQSSGPDEERMQSSLTQPDRSDSWR